MRRIIAVSDRPRVGISACLLGERVRYDGGDKRDDWLVDVLGPRVEWIAVCPEVEAGLGTPRPPMNLVRTAAGGVVLMTTTLQPELTETMQRYSERRAGQLAAARLDGYVLKAGSPSCGMDLGDAGRGLFAGALIERMPDLPVVDERQLADPIARERFVDRVFAHHRASKMER